MWLLGLLLIEEKGHSLPMWNMGYLQAITILIADNSISF